MGGISFEGRGVSKKIVRWGLPPIPHDGKACKESSHNQKQLLCIEETMKSSLKQNKKSCQFEFSNDLSVHSGSLQVYSIVSSTPSVS